MDYLLNNWEVLTPLVGTIMALITALIGTVAWMARSQTKSIQAITTHMMSVSKRLEDRNAAETQEAKERRELEIKHIEQSFDLQRQLDMTKKELAEYQIAMERQQTEITMIRDRAQAAEADAEIARQELRDERTAHEQQIDKLVTTFDDTMNDARDRINAKDAQILELSRELEKTNRKVAALEETVRDLTQQLDMMQKQAGRREQQLERITAERDQAIQERDAAIRERDELRQSVEELKARVNELETKYETINDKETA
jgi:chromosome segregation ATPase